MVAKLFYERKEMGEVSIELKKASLVIGRAGGVDLLIDYDNEISGRHAMITREGHNYSIEDLGSTNKTFINGKEIKTKEILNNKDEIKIGETLFLFVLEETEDIDKTAMGTVFSGRKQTVPSFSSSEGPLTAYVEYSRENLGSVRVNLDREFIKIGRSGENDIVLDYDEEVSSTHAQITKENNSYFIKDLGSTNKTFVNENTISKVKLQNKDKIKTGKTMFTFIDPSGKEEQSGTFTTVSPSPGAVPPAGSSTVPSTPLIPSHKNMTSKESKTSSGVIKKKRKKSPIKTYITMGLIIIACLAFYLYYNNSVKKIRKMDDLLSEAENHYEMGQFEEAINEYGELLELDDTKLEAIRGTGDCYKSMYDYLTAIEKYKETIKPYIKNKDELDFNKVQDLLTDEDKLVFIGKTGILIADCYYLNNNYDEAEKWYRYFEATDAMTNYQNKELRNLFSDALSGMGKVDVVNCRYEDGGAKYEKALHIDDKNLNVLINLGYLYIETGEYEEALSSFKSVLVAEEDNIKAGIGTGEVYKAEKKYDKALEAFEDIIKDYPDSHKAVEAYIKKAEIYRLRGDYDKAHDELDKAEKADDKNPSIYIERARVYYDGKEYDRAEKELDIVLNKDKGKHKNSIEGKLLSGNIYEKKGKEIEAIECYKEVTEIHPCNYEANNNLGRIYLKSKEEKDSDKAMKYLQAANDLKPYEKDNLVLLGEAYEGKKKYEEAIEKYTIAHEIDSKDPDLSCTLGDTYLDVGQPDKAGYYYNHALSINPDYDRAKQGLIKIGSL